MTKGVVFFTVGTSHVERLLVAVSSVTRQSPDLPVTVMAVRDGTPIWLSSELQKWGADLIWMEKELPTDGALTTKIASLQYAPYDINFFLDADMVVLQPLEPAFEALGDTDFAFVNFAGWRSDGKTIKKRIDSWSKVEGTRPDDIERAKKWGPAINVGSFIFRKGHPWLKEWTESTRLGAKARVFIPDEVYAQVCLPRLKHTILGPEWGASVLYGPHENPRIYHYHGDKHNISKPSCDHWRQARAAIQLPTVQGDNTVVIAVDAGYLDTLRKSYATWDAANLLQPNLHRLHVITDGTVSRGQLEEFVRFPFTLSGCQYIDGMSQRERMISAFVREAPYIVETPWWTKLDVDCTCTPETMLFHSGVWRNYDIVSHRWGYTKPGSWITLLENWRAKRNIGKPVDVGIVDPDKRTHAHPRFQSFVCLHRTHASRTMSDYVRDSRLPVPSHDSYYWFMSEALGLKVKTVNLKKWGFGHG